MIIVLDGSDVPNPEDMAMLQALYSRSPASVLSHLEKVRKVGSGKFVEKYVVGYGHDSINDCGNTVIFIENVSMLAAKAIQNNPLYNGQEVSTRYVDWTAQDVLDPLGCGEEIQEDWMIFYSQYSPAVEAHLLKTLPKPEDSSQGKFEKAVKARTFDIMRGFLPAGCVTSLSWSTTLRKASDHLRDLKHHPMKEVRDIAGNVWNTLQDKYPSSFPSKTYPETEEYLRLSNEDSLVDIPVSELTDGCEIDLNDQYIGLIVREPESIDYVLENPAVLKRPKHCRIPHRFDQYGLITGAFLLDYGSFRDLQRHRNGVCEVPLLTTKFGFHQWYLDQLPADVRKAAVDLLDAQEANIQCLPGTDVEKQAYVAMGYRVPCIIHRGLPSMVYMLELRTTKAVHPTLRSVMQELSKQLVEQLPNLTLHVDLDPDDWDLSRANQDITEKKSIWEENT